MTSKLNIPLHKRIYKILNRYGTDGASAYEIERELGDSVDRETIKRALREMERLAFVRPVAESRHRGNFAPDDNTLYMVSALAASVA